LDPILETIDGGQLLNGDFPGQSLDLGKEKAGLVVLIGENGLRGESAVKKSRV
jgi:hypothetical protein|tara:strand:+ start:685 stop:843 length:159 start_codon:yes stop_codon:yes gene_type:complete